MICFDCYMMNMVAIFHTYSVHFKMNYSFPYSLKNSDFYSPSRSSKPVWISFFWWTLGKIFWRMSATRQLMDPIDFHRKMEVNGVYQLFGYKHSLKYLLLWSAEERNVYRFETTWGWVNDDRIFIFKWTYSFNLWQGKTNGCVAQINQHHCKCYSINVNWI